MKPLKQVGAPLAIAVLVLASISSAPAAVTLSLDDLSTPGVDVTVVDGDADGVVTFNGSLGIWSLNITTGRSKPNLGSTTSPLMDLVSINLSTGPGTLVLMLSDDGFGPTDGNPISRIGGTVNGSGSASSVTYNTFADASNTILGLGTPLTSHGPFGPGAFSGAAEGPAFPAGPYSLTQRIELVHNGEGASSFNATLEGVSKAVPEGGSALVLLGIAAMSIDGLRRRFGRRVS